MDKCRYPECLKPVYSRGLCKKHYMVALMAVRTGETSWAELEAKGKSKRVRSSEIRNWFLDSE